MSKTAANRCGQSDRTGGPERRPAGYVTDIGEEVVSRYQELRHLEGAAEIRRIATRTRWAPPGCLALHLAFLGGQRRAGGVKDRVPEPALRASDTPRSSTEVTNHTDIGGSAGTVWPPCRGARRDVARSGGKRVVAVCDMVAAVLDHHPEFESIAGPVTPKVTPWARGLLGP